MTARLILNEKKEEQLNKKIEELESQKAEVEVLHTKQIEELERISGLTRDEAKTICLTL